MKKIYSKPETIIVVMSATSHILAGSGETMNVYDTPVEGGLSRGYDEW